MGGRRSRLAVMLALVLVLAVASVGAAAAKDGKKKRKKYMPVATATTAAQPTLKDVAWPADPGSVDMCALLGPEDVSALLGATATPAPFEGQRPSSARGTFLVHGCTWNAGDNSLRVLAENLAATSDEGFRQNCAYSGTPLAVKSLGPPTCAWLNKTDYLVMYVDIYTTGGVEFSLDLVRRDRPADPTMLEELRQLAAEALANYGA